MTEPTEPTDSDGPKTPIDRALDVLVFLPVGAMLDVPHSIPRYIEVGRRQIHSLARLGAGLMSGPARDPGGALERLQAHTRTTLRALGVGPDDDGHQGPFDRGFPHDDGAHAAGARGAAGVQPGPGPEPVAPVTLVAVPSPPATVEPGPDVEALAIPDYDSLSASQVVPRLDSLNADELEAVRLYENAKRGRKTILSKIAQLQVS